MVNRGFFWQQQQQKITGLFQGNTVISSFKEKTGGKFGKAERTEDGE